MAARRTVLGGATLAAGAATIAASAVRHAVTGQRAPRTAVSNTTRMGRAARVWSVAARGVARRGLLRIRTIGADDDRRSELDTNYAIRTAADVSRELGEMRGVMMKVGQMLSFLLEGLPESSRSALATLQDAAPPMHPALAAAVVADELGEQPDRLFATWDPEPIAAASIGQVHRAETSTGELVAVKVQYPNVGDAITADLANTAVLYALLGKWFRALDAEALVGEFRDRIIEELDYEQEAHNQAEFASMFAGHPWVRIPRPMPEYSSKRVLSSEWTDGVRLTDFIDVAPAEVRQRSAEVVWRFAQHSIHRHRVFNGDPNPGNFRFHPDGTVSFLDFGMVKRWRPGEWEHLRGTLDAVILQREPEAIRDAMRRSGFLDPDSSVDPVRLAEYVSAPYEPYIVDGGFEFTPEWHQNSLRRATALGAENADIAKALNIPTSFLILNRVVWGVNALMTRLGASGPFREMLLEYIAGGEPATELGVAEAEWQRHLNLDNR